MKNIISILALSLITSNVNAKVISKNYFIKHNSIMYLNGIDTKVNSGVFDIRYRNGDEVVGSINWFTHKGNIKTECTLIQSYDNNIGLMMDKYYCI